MRPWSGCLAVIILLSLLFWTGSRAATALGDGGTLRAWKRHGDYEIAAFTEPSPVVTGSVDISVLILDHETGEPIEDARIVVEVRPKGRPAEVMSHRATRQAATNQLLRAAVFELRDPGRRVVNIRIEGPNDQTQIQFEMDVGRAWSPQAGIWPWILWPLPVVVLYGIHCRWVAKGRKRSRSRRDRSSEGTLKKSIVINHVLTSPVVSSFDSNGFDSAESC
jgi:hypothetical protein